MDAFVTESQTWTDDLNEVEQELDDRVEDYTAVLSAQVHGFVVPKQRSKVTPHTTLASRHPWGRRLRQKAKALDESFYVVPAKHGLFFVFRPVATNFSTNTIHSMILCVFSLYLQ